MRPTHDRAGGAARGVTRLAFDAVAETTRIVEGMHANIAATPLPLGPGSDGQARGIAGLVYGGIRWVSAAAGSGVDRALALLDGLALADLALPQPQWDAALGVLNGVLGDHLAAQGNPLAIPMQLRRNGTPLASASALPGRRFLLLAHGLCLNDRRWHAPRHDPWTELARELGYEPIDLVYNTGRHVSENGRALAALLEERLAARAEPVEELVILAHSMGGLVTRSACHFAAEAGHAWLRALRRIVFLGTPHHGAPLERVGHWVHNLAERSPYVAPLARLAKLRSAGITDLRHASLLDEDWRGRDRFVQRAERPRRIPLPEGVACHAIAGTLRAAGGRLGDGLVPVESALGRHPDPNQALAIPESHQWVGEDLGHLALLERPEVTAAVRSWLAAT